MIFIIVVSIIRVSSLEQKRKTDFTIEDKKVEAILERLRSIQQLKKMIKDWVEMDVHSQLMSAKKKHEDCRIRKEKLEIMWSLLSGAECKARSQQSYSQSTPQNSPYFSSHHTPLHASSVRSIYGTSPLKRPRPSPFSTYSQPSNSPFSPSQFTSTPNTQQHHPLDPSPFCIYKHFSKYTHLPQDSCLRS